MAKRSTWHTKAAEEKVRAAGVVALTNAAHMLFEASQRDVPVASGELKRSGRVRINAEELKATITYGEGLDDARAVLVHEKMGMHHKHGGAKYLEKPFTSGAAKVRNSLAADLRRQLQ